MSNSKEYYLQSWKENYSVDFPFLKKSAKGKGFAYCMICNCDISISHGGRTDITLHAGRKKHKENFAANQKSLKLDNFFKHNTTDFEKSVTNAECLFTSFLLEHNLPISCADHAGQLFRKMFPDSKIAKSYGCARTKTSNIIQEIASEKEEFLKETLQNSLYSVAIDGSNDTDSKLHSIVVTYFNSSLSKIDCVLLCIPSLEDSSTGVNIGNLLLQNLQTMRIPIDNCVALSCDNAPVMLGEKAGVISVLKKANANICAIGCCCHLINLAAEKGSSSLPFKIDEMLVDIYYYLEKSANRKQRLKELQKLHDKDVRKILKHVCTRWLSVNLCLTRMLEQWLPLTVFFKEECKKQNILQRNTSLSFYRIPKKSKTESVANSKQNKSMCSQNSVCSTSKTATKRKDTSSKQDEQLFLNREERIFYFLSSDLNKSLCYFILNITAVFDKINTFLQSQSPQIHLLRPVLLNLMKDVLIRFIKPNVITQCKTYLLVDYNNILNQKDNKDLIVGSAAMEIVDTLCDEDRDIFFTAVRKYFCTVCDYMRLKFPFSNEIVCNAEVADLSKISINSFSKVKFFLDKYPSMLKMENKREAIDKIQEQFCALQVESELLESVKDERIDQQWCRVSQIKNELGKKKYELLANIMLNILIFPHSNAECERVFSQVKKTRTQFRSAMSDKMLQNILIAKDTSKKCYESCFDDKFLKKAKMCTYECNKLK